MDNKLLRDMLLDRKKKAQSLLKKHGQAWIVISDGKNDDNIEYLLGLHTFGTSVALLSEDYLYVLVSRLEKSFVEDLPHIDDYDTYYGSSEFKNKLEKTIKKISGGTILANYASPSICRHASQLPHALFRTLQYLSETYEISLKPSGKYVYDLRFTKLESEFRVLEKSVDLTLRALEEIRDYIKVGKTEREIMAKLYQLTYNVGEPSFEPIVAANINTKNPHHISSDNKIKPNSILYIDFGIRYLTLSADITRVYAIGSIPDNIIKAYNAVKEAQDSAISVAKVGAKFGDVDKAARDTLSHLGYEPNKYFVHALGHPIGVDVHDVGPPFYETVDEKIPAGVAYTIEPGLYFEDEKFGIRLEDDIIILRSGVKRLSKSPDEPIAI